MLAKLLFSTTSNVILRKISKFTNNLCFKNAFARQNFLRNYNEITSNWNDKGVFLNNTYKDRFNKSLLRKKYPLIALEWYVIPQEPEALKPALSPNTLRAQCHAYRVNTNWLLSACTLQNMLPWVSKAPMYYVLNSIVIAMPAAMLMKYSYATYGGDRRVRGFRSHAWRGLWAPRMAGAFGAMRSWRR